MLARSKFAALVYNRRSLHDRNPAGKQVGANRVLSLPFDGGAIDDYRIATNILSDSC